MEKICIQRFDPCTDIRRAGMRVSAVKQKVPINKKGEIINEEISKSVHPLLDAEALRVAKLLGNFVPGQEDGEKTSTIYNLPIQFQIDN